MRRTKVCTALILLLSLVIAISCYFYMMPSKIIIYDYNSNAYIQNTKSIIKHKIKLYNYTDINNVVVTNEGWYCCAKENGKGCFLFVTKDNKVKKIMEDSYYHSTAQSAIVVDNKYVLTYSFIKTKGSDNDNTSLLFVDFTTGKLLYNELPNALSYYSVLSDGKNIYGCDSEKIYVYNSGIATEIAKGTNVLGIDNNNLYYYNNDLYCINLTTLKAKNCNYNVNPYEYSTVDFLSLCVKNDVSVGCKLGYLKYSDGTALLSHSTITNLNTKTKFVLLGSVGKEYENIQVVDNLEYYQMLK